MEGCGSTDCTFHLAPTLTAAAVHCPGIAKMGTHAVCGMREGGENKARCQMGGGEEEVC